MSHSNAQKMKGEKKKRKEIRSRTKGRRVSAESKNQILLHRAQDWRRSHIGLAGNRKL